MARKAWVLVGALCLAVATMWVIVPVGAQCDAGGNCTGDDTDGFSGSTNSVTVNEGASVSNDGGDAVNVNNNPVSNGNTDTTVTNNGSVEATGGDSGTDAIEVINSGTGDVTIDNNGTADSENGDALRAENSLGGGDITVNNNGDISGGDNGINVDSSVLGGETTVDNNADITVNVTSPDEDFNAGISSVGFSGNDIDSSGDVNVTGGNVLPNASNPFGEVSVGVAGGAATGTSDTNVSGDVTVTGSPVSVGVANGSSTGSASTDVSGEVNTSGSVNSAGVATVGSTGAETTVEGDITVNATAGAAAGIGSSSTTGESNVTNNGDITATGGAGSFGIAVLGDGTTTNTGNITADVGFATDSAEVEAVFDLIPLDGAPASPGTSSNQTFTTSGDVTGTSGVAITTGAGDDTVNIEDGATINGLIDGGADTDVLNIDGGEACEGDTFTDNSGLPGTLTGNGRTYSYANFESVNAEIEDVACGSGGRTFTRINYPDIMAPMAGFCQATTVELYLIVNNAGDKVAEATVEVVSAALAFGDEREIVSVGEVALWTLPNGKLQLRGPGGYRYAFAGDYCGPLS